LLKLMAGYSGISEDRYDEVFIILDKMDKIGIDGVKEELLKAEFAEESVDKYLKLFDGINRNSEPLKYLIDMLGDDAVETITSLQEIIDAVEASKTAEFKMVFDPTLVRGMGYYTGTIFEIAMPQLGAACGGGGRYDKMVGRFTGQDVPACGFSIGFERIILILTESGFKIPGAPKKVCIMIDKKYPQEKLPEVMKKAAELREEGNAVLVVRMNKNKKFQKDQLMASGYENFIEYFAD
ncbi:MAG: ATP phosphoribosyltransferase regulatory subunit, partial [Lachnospiraceae bacterium]|nr:ATP phosphoribosyltransferase regulatory subunit [Lachnospiraceae bacterium]